MHQTKAETVGLCSRRPQCDKTTAWLWPTDTRDSTQNWDQRLVTRWVFPLKVLQINSGSKSRDSTWTLNQRLVGISDQLFSGAPLPSSPLSHHHLYPPRLSPFSDCVVFIRPPLSLLMTTAGLKAASFSSPPPPAGVHAVLGGLPPLLLPPLGEDEPPLAGAGLRRHLSGHPGLLRSRHLLRLLLQRCEWRSSTATFFVVLWSAAEMTRTAVSCSSGARSTCWPSCRSSWPSSAPRSTPITSTTTGGGYASPSSAAWRASAWCRRATGCGSTTASPLTLCRWRVKPQTPAFHLLLPVLLLCPLPQISLSGKDLNDFFGTERTAACREEAGVI